MICPMAAEAHSFPAGGEPLDLRTVIDTIPALVVCALPDGSIEFVNQGWREYTGSGSALPAGGGWRSVIHPDDVSKFMDEWNAALSAGEQFENEARVRRADGQYRWFLVRNVPLRGQSDQIVRWYGTGYDIEDRKQGENHLRLVVDTTPALIHTARPDGYLDYFNKRWLEYLGLTLKDVCGWRWTNSIHPEDVEGILEKWRAALTSGEPFEMETRVRRADGAYRWMLHRKFPLCDDSGNILKWYGSSLDIEDRKRAEEALRASEEQWRNVFENNPTMYFMVDAAGTVLAVNPFGAEQLGYGVDELVAESLLNVSYASDRETLQRYLAHCFNHIGQSISWELRKVRVDGSLLWVRETARAVLRGNEPVLLIACEDITERKNAEGKVREQEMELRQMLDLTPQHVHVLTADAKLLYTNAIALKYHGLALDDWSDRRLHQWRIDELPMTLFHPDDRKRVLSELNASLLSGNPHETEARLVRHDGKYFWFLFRYNPLRDEQGRVLRWYVAGTDIEDRKRAEERLQNENVALREEIDKASMFEEIVGASPPLRAVLARVSKVARTDSSVLITGETGTGKELVARAIHRRSLRSSQAFVCVNCAAVPRDLIASELFGHEKGAFTGATQRRLGRFELAGGGSIFLDEVGELPAETQIALLRVLQEHEFDRVGGTRSIKTDVRVIAATNRDLQAAIAGGTFRSDLFYRLNVFPIEIPPLRERPEDIPLLVEYFIDRFARKAGKTIRELNKKSLELLQSYPWPGNIRELQNVIERSIIVCETETFSVDESWLSRQHLASESAHNSLDLSQRLAAQEKQIIEAALRECDGRVFGPSGAAVRLGMPRSTLESKIRSLNINKNRFKASSPKPR